MSIEDLFNATLNVETKSVVADGYGSENDTWNVTTASVPCRIRNVGATRWNLNDKMEFIYTHKVWIGSTVSVDETTDRITIGSTNYEVIAVKEATGHSTIHHKILQVLEVK